MPKPLIAAICLFLVCLGDPSAQSAWTVRHPLPTQVQFEGVAWTGKLYVAVGHQNTIVTSPDGIEWTLRQSDTAGIWHTLVWTGEFLMAIGSGFACMTSPDGIAWTRRPAVPTGISDLAAHDGLVMGVGHGGFIRSTRDGLTWDIVSTSPNLNAVTWGNGAWMAVGSEGQVMSSRNGLDWERHKAPTSGYFNAVAWTDSLWVAVGSCSDVFTSPDGVTWTERSTLLSCSEFRSVAWTGNRVVAHGDWLATSPDGITWKKADVDSFPHENVRDMIWADSQLVAVGQDGTLQTSPDGLAWTERRSGHATSLLDIAVGDGKAVAVGYDRTLSSPDGIRWKAGSVPAGNSLRAVAWAGDRWVAVGEKGAVCVSPDGETWTRRGAFDTLATHSLAWTGSLLVAGGYHGRIHTSPDGETWTLRQLPTQNAILGITWDGTRLIAVGSKGTVATSRDGVAWDLRVLWEADDYEDVAWSGQTYVAIAINGNTAVSSDGQTWTRRWLPNDGAVNYGIAWVGDRFLATSGGALHSSPDGLGWIREPATVGETLKEVIRLGARFVAVGDRGTVLTREAETVAIRRRRSAAGRPGIRHRVPDPVDLLGRRAP